jgi:ASC-1-like (ASCH) protein
MTHILKLQPKYFESVKNGIKVIELRLLDEKRQKIKIGDEIEFKKEPNLEESIIVKVKGLLLYKTFEELIEDYPLEWLSDNTTTKEELIEILNTFYSKEEQEKYGVIGIRIEKK